MDAGADDTRAKLKQFGVLLCLPMAPVLLLIWNGDFGMPPIYGHRREDASYPINMDVGCRTLSATGVERFILDERLANVRFGSLADITARPWHVRFTPESGH